MIDFPMPEHLRCTRTRPANTPADFQPPYPSYSVRFPERAYELVMAIIGAQYKTAADADGAAQSTLSTFLTGPTNPPSFFERVSVTDNKDFYNISTVADWSSKVTYEAWAEQSGFRGW